MSIVFQLIYLAFGYDEILKTSDLKNICNYDCSGIQFLVDHIDKKLKLDTKIDKDTFVTAAHRWMTFYKCYVPDENVISTIYDKIILQISREKTLTISGFLRYLKIFGSFFSSFMKVSCLLNYSKGDLQPWVMLDKTREQADDDLKKSQSILRMSSDAHRELIWSLRQNEIKDGKELDSGVKQHIDFYNNNLGCNVRARPEDITFLITWLINHNSDITFSVQVQDDSDKWLEPWNPIWKKKSVIIPVPAPSPPLPKPSPVPAVPSQIAVSYEHSHYVNIPSASPTPPTPPTPASDTGRNIPNPPS